MPELGLEMGDFFLDEEDVDLDSDLDELSDLDNSDEEQSQDDKAYEVKEEPKKDEPTSSKTTTVDRYSSEKFSYPCFMLESSVEFPRHILSALARMIESSLEVPNKINIYVDNKGELLSIGGISPVQVKAAIDLLGRSNIVAYYKEDYILTDDLIYVLSA